VHDSNGVDLDTFPSAMGIITRLACGRAKQEAIEVDAVLCKAGLTHQQIDDPRARLPVKAQIRFLELAATALRDDCLGFHLAQNFDLRMAGLFHYVLASSDTLDEALQRAARYSAIVNEGITLRFREGRDIVIRFDYAGVARHTDSHQIEFAMVTLVRTCRQLTNRHVSASRVSFTHQRRKDIAEFRTFFGSDVAFGAAVDEMAFSPSIRQMLWSALTPTSMIFWSNIARKQFLPEQQSLVLLNRVSRTPLLNFCHMARREQARSLAN
jgi:Arabinose-binding domain of AraC transcription regulator, N-term